MVSKLETPAAHPPAKTSILTFVRLAGWGFCAALAIGVALTLSQTERGAERIKQAMSGPLESQRTAETQRQAPAPQIAQRTYDPELETRRLAQQLAVQQQQMQVLAADRDQLATRVASLERNFEDVTGSVKAVTTSRITAPPKVADIRTPDAKTAEPKTAEVLPPPPALSAPMTVAATPNPPIPANDNKPSQTPPPIRAAEAPKSEIKDLAATGTVAANAPPNVPMPQPRIAAPEPGDSAKDSAKDMVREAHAALEPLGKLDYAIDLGGAQTIDGLRALWATTKTAHAPLLDNLQPAAILRPTGKNGAPQLRLMAGPFADAGAAAAICKSFVGKGGCRPFAHDGQKLPLR